MTRSNPGLPVRRSAELLDQLGEQASAREAREKALELCPNPAERSLLEKRLRA